MKCMFPWRKLIFLVHTTIPYNHEENFFQIFRQTHFHMKPYNNNNNNNDILLRAHGPYHRQKSTKSVLLYISAHYRNGVST